MRTKQQHKNRLAKRMRNNVKRKRVSEIKRKLKLQAQSLLKYRLETGQVVAPPKPKVEVNVKENRHKQNFFSGIGKKLRNFFSGIGKKLRNIFKRV